MWKWEHHKQGELQLLGNEPKIFMTPEAYSDMKILVDEYHQELGWLGAVTRNDNEFTITQIFLVGQHATHGSCTLSASGQADVGTEILMSDNPEVFDSLFLWGHSHVNFEAVASPQDDSQLNTLASKSSSGYFVRVIANKQGHLNFTIQFEVHGFKVRVNNVPWFVLPPDLDNSRRERWIKEITAKVGPRLPPLQRLPSIARAAGARKGPIQVTRKKR